MLTVWVYDKKWYEILECHVFLKKNNALDTDNVSVSEIHQRMTAYFSAAVSSCREPGESRDGGGLLWLRQSPCVGLRMDRMESVNQRGLWWPERPAAPPEPVARWWEHRYLSHYHRYWWTHTSLRLCIHDGRKTPHLLTGLSPAPLSSEERTFSMWGVSQS